MSRQLHDGDNDQGGTGERHHAMTVGQCILSPADVATRPLGAPTSAASWPGSSEGTTPSQASPGCCKAGEPEDLDLLRAWYHPCCCRCSRLDMTTCAPNLTSSALLWQALCFPETRSTTVTAAAGPHWKSLAAHRAADTGPLTCVALLQACAHEGLECQGQRCQDQMDSLAHEMPG